MQHIFCQQCFSQRSFHMPYHSPTFTSGTLIVSGRRAQVHNNNYVVHALLCVSAEDIKSNPDVRQTTIKNRVSIYFQIDSNYAGERQRTVLPSEIYSTQYNYKYIRSFASHQQNCSLIEINIFTQTLIRIYFLISMVRRLRTLSHSLHYINCI